MESSVQTHVELRGIEKRFGPVRVLADINVRIRRGSVHALVGENGAGKSTLAKIVAGIHRPDGGQLIVNGVGVSYRSPHDALKDRLTIVAQELSLMPARTVAENVLLGTESRRMGFVRDRDMARRYQELEERVGFGIAGDLPVGSLRLADQQKVEIMRAVARGAELVVMDEPTAALDDDEARRLCDVVRQITRDGTTVIFVSHNLQEVLGIADEVTILRDGRHVRTGHAETETPESLITGMIGRSIDGNFPEKRRVDRDRRPVLEVRNLSSTYLRDITLNVFPGEIVGLAGLVGSGRSEIAHAIFGADRCTGSVHVDEQPVAVGSLRAAMRAGIALVPESRKEQGLMLGRSVVENVTIAGLPDFASASFVRRRAERQRAEEMLEGVGVRGGSPSAPAMALSGGNQQKVLLGKWLLRRPRVLIADEPTRGVDIGAKRAIYDLLHGLAEQGMGVLLIASDLEEVLGLSHRVVVMRGGRVAAELMGDDANEDRILRLAFGAHESVGGAS